MDQLEIDKLKDRVERGADLLDETEPKWFKRVNMNNLRMGSCTQCVLGQVAGHYFHGIRYLLHIETNEAIEHGFELDDHYNDIASSEMYYTHLDELWLKEIKSRLTQN